MTKYLLIFLLMHSYSYAVENSTMELNVREATYVRPESGTGVGGKVSFYEFNMFRDGMYINLKNQKKIFDANIFIRPSFLGFSSKLLNMGFTLDPKTFLKKVQETKLINSKLSITEKFFNFSGNYFGVTASTFNFKLSKFRIFCTAHGELNPASSEGIVAGCMTSGVINGNREDGTTLVEINYSLPEEGKDVRSKLGVKEFTLKKDHIRTVLESIKGNMNHFQLQSDLFTINCQKDPTLLTLESEKILADCLNYFDGKITNLNLLNTESKSAFHFNIDSLRLREKSFSVDIPTYKFFGKEEPTTVIGLKGECMRDETTDLLDLVSIIESCLKKSTFFIHNVLGGEKGERDDFLAMFESDMSKEYDASGGEASSISKMKVTIENGETELNAKIKLMFLDRKIQVWGNSKYLADEGVLEILITKARLPFGIKSRPLLYYFIKMKMDDEDVYVKGNKLYIKM